MSPLRRFVPSPPCPGSRCATRSRRCRHPRLSPPPPACSCCCWRRRSPHHGLASISPLLSSPPTIDQGGARHVLGFGQHLRPHKRRLQVPGASIQRVGAVVGAVGSRSTHAFSPDSAVRSLHRSPPTALTSSRGDGTLLPSLRRSPTPRAAPSPACRSGGARGSASFVTAPHLLSAVRPMRHSSTISHRAQRSRVSLLLTRSLPLGLLLPPPPSSAAAALLRTSTCPTGPSPSSPTPSTARAVFAAARLTPGAAPRTRNPAQFRFALSSPARVPPPSQPEF